MLIDVLAKNDPRSRKAEQLLAAGRVLSVQILNEFVSVPRRKLLMSWNEVTEALAVGRAMKGHILAQAELMGRYGR